MWFIPGLCCSCICHEGHCTLEQYHAAGGISMHGQRFVTPRTSTLQQPYNACDVGEA